MVRIIYPRLCNWLLLLKFSPRKPLLAEIEMMSAISILIKVAYLSAVFFVSSPGNHWPLALSSNTLVNFPRDC